MTNQHLQYTSKFTMQNNKPLPEQQLPQCEVCHLDPVPQSSQHILLLILEVGLIFLNWKFSIILLMLGYSFPKTHWKCPYCTRQINVNKQNNPSDSIFLRMGKCMALFSLNKFRIFAAAIIIWMVYLFATEPHYDPKKYVTKTWQSMAKACGFEVYMENSVRSNKIFNNYIDSGYDWQIEGIYLSREPSGIENYEHVFIKMNPTQFKDPNAYDFKAFTNLVHGKQINRGEVLRLKGQWEGRQYHNFIFNPIEVKKTGQFKDPSTVSFMYDKNSLLRSHLDVVKSQFQQSNNKNVDSTQTKTQSQ